jgi:hypothetical protein
MDEARERCRQRPLADLRVGIQEQHPIAVDVMRPRLLPYANPRFGREMTRAAGNSCSTGETLPPVQPAATHNDVKLDVCGGLEERQKAMAGAKPRCSLKR